MLIRLPFLPVTLMMDHLQYIKGCRACSLSSSLLSISQEIPTELLVHSAQVGIFFLTIFNPLHCGGVIHEWCCDVLSMFALSKWRFWNLFGAPKVLTRRCEHFPTDICSVIQEGEITVEKSATRCHLDETNMDITTVHRICAPRVGTLPSL